MKISRATMPSYIVLMLVVLAGCIPLGMEPLPTPTVVPPTTHVVDDVVDIEPIWVADRVYIHLNEHDATLDSSAGKTCFLGNYGERHKYYDNLICLESQSGNILWNNESGAHGEIAVTSDGIFVTYHGPTSIQKYDFQNGNSVWEKYLGGTGSDYLYFQDGQIEVLFRTEKTMILNVDGREIRTIDSKSVFVSQRDEILIDLDGLQANKANTDHVLWKYEDMNIIPAPLFTDDKIFVRKFFSNTAYALDRNAGALLWEIPKILGNFAYSPNKQVVYALRENGNLLAIDENSGKENVIAKFSPAPFAYSDGIDDAGYQLSYDEKEHILVVYTGDSRQLFAFQED